MRGHEAAHALHDLDGVRQLLAKAAREALAFRDALAASSPSPAEDDVMRRRRELSAHLVRAIADAVADALEAVNEMADELAEPRQGG